MAKYLAELAVDIFESYAREANSVELKFGVADIAMELDLAVPCGLIFNERISNAFKTRFARWSAGGKPHRAQPWRVRRTATRSRGRWNRHARRF